VYKDFLSIKYSTGVGHLIDLSQLSYQWLSLIGFKHRNLFVVNYIYLKFINIFFLFYLENSERFVLYSLCGCFIGIAIILLMIIIVLYIEKRHRTNEKMKNIKNAYQIPRTDLDYNDILSDSRSYLPIYRYDGRTHNGTYHI